MDCVYGVEDCSHCKCLRCGECTNGSQIHRVCWPRDEEDNEISELLASATECLPTEEQEAAAKSIQSDTPISLQVEEQLAFEESFMDLQTYRFEMCETDMDIAHKTLSTVYPNEDFDSPAFQRLHVHKYLTSEMTRFEFFIAHKQWGADIIRFPTNHEIRMRKGVVSKFNKKTQEHEVYHISCIDTEQRGFLEKGFTKALLSIEARNNERFVELMTEVSNLFFCKHCDHYMFDCVEFYTTKVWAIPDEDVWPKCEHMLHTCTLHDEYTYGTLMAHKLIGIVYPQEPPKKRRRILFDIDSD